ATAAAWTRVRERLGLVGLGTAGHPGLGLCRLHVQQAARLSDVVAAGAAGKQAVVANAVEALRQDVDQESADELGSGQCHDLLAITTFSAIVLPSEGHAVAVAGHQPAVGDGDAVGIARQIGQHGLWAAKRTLGIDRPFGSAQRSQMTRERLWVGESGVSAEELETTGLVCGEELLQK